MSSRERVEIAQPEESVMSASFDIGFVKDYAPDADARVKLTNGRFVDVAGGRCLEPGADVTIKGGRIESIGDASGAAETAAPDFTIDLHGRAVIPGLFNTHTHLAMTLPTGSVNLKDVRLAKKHHDRQIAKNMAECLAHGVTTVRDAWTPNLNHNRALKDSISRGDMPGPRIIQSVLVGPLGGYLAEDLNLIMRTAQKFIFGATPIGYAESNSGSVIFPKNAGEDEIRAAVDRAVDERGAECIKIGEQLENMINFKPDMSIMKIKQLSALADQARNRGVKSTIHHVSVETFRRALDAGVSSLAHAPFNALLTDSDVDKFISGGGIIEPSATVSYDVCWKIKGDEYCDHPEMDRLTRFREGTFAGLIGEYWLPELEGRAMAGYRRMTRGKMKALGLLSTENLYRYYSGIVADGSENLRKLFEAGGCFACGSDGGVPPSTPAMVGHELKTLGFSLNGESGNGKFTGVEALRVATINSARAVGVEDELGSIEAGKKADLVIVDGDPLADIGVIGSRAAALFLDGRLSINNCGLEVAATGG